MSQSSLVGKVSVIPNNTLTPHSALPHLLKRVHFQWFKISLDGSALLLKIKFKNDSREADRNQKGEASDLPKVGQPVTELGADLDSWLQI